MRGSESRRMFNLVTSDLNQSVLQTDSVLDGSSVKTKQLNNNLCKHIIWTISYCSLVREMTAFSGIY